MNVTHKARVVKEVLETEETYYRTLDAIVTHYEEPASALFIQLHLHVVALLFSGSVYVIFAPDAPETSSIR